MSENINKPTRRSKKVFVPILIVVALFGLSAIVMLLWNAILPDVLNVTAITYWQAMGLLVLCKILFGGFGPGGPRRRPPFGPNRQGGRGRWEKMDPDDKMKFRDEWKRRCDERKNH